jgi:hypothetical protein
MLNVDCQVAQWLLLVLDVGCWLLIVYVGLSLTFSTVGAHLCSKYSTWMPWMLLVRSNRRRTWILLVNQNRRQVFAVPCL